MRWSQGLVSCPLGAVCSPWLCQLPSSPLAVRDPTWIPPLFQAGSWNFSGMCPLPEHQGPGLSVRHTQEKHVAFCPEQRTLLHPTYTITLLHRGSSEFCSHPHYQGSKGRGFGEAVVPGGAIKPHMTWKGARDWGLVSIQ